MHTLSEWFTKNPVAANLLMILILVAGYFTATSIRIEGFPPLPPDSVSITTVYPGASVKQVDRAVTSRIELELEGMPGLKKIFSSSSRAYSMVIAQKTTGFNLDRFQNEIKTRIDAIENLPEASERPVVSRDEFKIEALLVQVYGGVDKDSLQRSARLTKNTLLKSPEITRLEEFGLLPYEVRIELDQSKLLAHGLSLNDIANAINTSSLNYRTGSLKSKSGEILISADRKAFSYEEFSKITVIARKTGEKLKLKDISEIVDDYGEYESFARFQGKPSVGFLVYTSHKASLFDVSKAAKKAVEKMKPALPEKTEIEIWGESSVYMQNRLNLLKSNAVQGLLIVFVILTLFLNFRVALWIAMGIPISIAGTVAVMGPKFLDHSLNDITTFGIIIVLGILVDDAVVVGESVFEERSKTNDPVSGTIKGVHKVAKATVFGCFTTIAAFFPILLIDNTTGKVFAGFSVVAIISLLMSLMESKFILPAHLASVNILNEKKPNIISKLLEKIKTTATKALSFVNYSIYKPLLTVSIKHRYSALVIFSTVGIIGITMIFNNQIRTVFFPEVPGQIITIKMKMTSGSPLYLTIENLNRIEKTAKEINSEVMKKTGTKKPPVLKIMSALENPLECTIYAELQKEEDRAVETMEIVRKWRRKLGTPEGVEKLTITGSMLTGGGFEILLLGKNIDILKEAYKDFSDKIKEIDGVENIYEDLKSSKPQISLILKKEAEHLGLTVRDLARQIGDSYGGLEVQRFQRGSEEVKVIVRYSDDKRKYISDLLGTRVKLPSNKWIPLSSIAVLKTGYTPSNINRDNGKRVIRVKVRLDKEKASPTEVFKKIKNDIKPRITGKYPGIEIRGSGELEEIGEIRGGLKKALIMIVILIYVLIAVPLKSYLQPVVIMSVIPFGFVGAAIGHKIADFPLSILSFFGMLAVMGIVVNDSLVMLTRFNDLRDEGLPFNEALIEAGSSRFRAIFLTTATTVSGLLPLLSETSEQAQYLIPAAISLAYGELFATPVTLILVPLLIKVFEDIKKFSYKLFMDKNAEIDNIHRKSNL